MVDEQRRLEASAGRDADPSLRVLYAATDPNPLLVGRNRYALYDEMRKSDPAVRAALALVKVPLLSAHVRVMPASDDPADREVADACAWQMGLADQDGPLDQTHTASLAQALLCLDWGSMWEEIVWARDVETWRNANGDARIVRPIARLAPRVPATIQSVDFDPATGRLLTVSQNLPDAKPMPGSKLCRYVIDPEPGDWSGTALTRAMYGAWRLKKLLLVASGIGWDRHAAGVPVVRFPTGSGSEGLARAEEIGRTFRNHERGYVAFEGPEPTPGQDGWALNVVGGAGTLADPTPLLRLYDEQIAKASLAMFSALGTTQTGSRAVGETLADPFYQACVAVGRMILDERTRRVLAPFVAENFGAGVAVPRLEVTKVAPRSIPVIAAALADLANAGMYLADAELQDDVRALLDLPALPDYAVEDGRVVGEGSPPALGVDPLDPFGISVPRGQAFAELVEGEVVFDDARIVETAAARVVVEQERLLAEERDRRMADTGDAIAALAAAVTASTEQTAAALAQAADAIARAAERAGEPPVVNVAPPVVHVAAPPPAPAPVVNVPGNADVAAALRTLATKLDALQPAPDPAPVEWRIVEDRSGRPVGIKPKTGR